MKNPKKTIKLSKSCISIREKDAVISVLEKEYLGMGKEVKEFEKKLTSFFNRETICVNSGTAALQLALEACDIGIGDEVLVPSLTYVASFQSISATGAKPVACDISENNFLIDLSDAQKHLNKNTKAIMPVHFGGGVGDLESVYNFAKKNKLRVIEDAAHAFGTKYKNKRIGSIGDITCFSFDGIKNITSGEGGCIVTSDQTILNRIKDARLLGVEKDTLNRYKGLRSWDFDVSRQGWRYHMSNINAAIGLVQFDRFDSFKKIRCERAKLYDKLFFDQSNIFNLPNDYNFVVPHIYSVRLKGIKNRELLRTKLLEEKIETGIHYFPNHLLTFYKTENNSLKITEKVSQEIITLPLHPDIKIEEINYIAERLIHHLNNTLLF